VTLEINELKKAEVALKEAYDIVNKSPAVAFLWENKERWPVEFVSDNVKALFGYTAEDFTSGSVSYVDVVYPKDLERVAEEVSEFSSQEGVERFSHEPYRIITKDGTVKWVRDNTYIRRDQQGQITHYQGIVVDITERRETEDALRESEMRFRTLVESSPAGIFLIDDHYRFAYANKELSKILGISLEKIPGLDFRDILDDESREFVADRYARRQRGEELPSRYEVGIVHKDGDKRRLEMVATAIRSPDGSVRTMGQVLDITDRKRTEEELARHRDHLGELVKERTGELEKAQEKLLKRERLAVLGQLTATVSHELRNPLAVIRVSSFYLRQRDKGQDEKITKHIKRIEDQMDICDSIVSDLLEYTRGSQSQMIKGEFNPWLEDVLDEISETEGVKVEKALTEKLPKVFFDPEKMRRVIVNLVQNALQAVSERKRVEKDEAFQPMVEVSSKATDNGVMITVKDNGIGMDKETWKRAFEPLFTTKARGTGLGLANVHKIIKEHNGSVSLESLPHEGTKAIIVIPADD